MAIETVARVPPGAALVNEIDRRRASAVVQAAGLGPVLEMLRAYIVATESRLAALEAAAAPAVRS